jgi:hypothetical protein
MLMKLSAVNTVFFKSRFLQGLLIMGACAGLFGCGNGDNTPDVSGIQVELRTRRLDQDLQKIDTNDVAPGLAALQKEYPAFLGFYLDTLMGFGIQGQYTNDNPGVGVGFRSYLTYKDYRGVFDSVNKHYPDVKNINDKLEKGFKYTKYYIPGYKEPNVVYIVSWLSNWAAFTYDSTLGIGLDMFLGEGYPFYKSVGIPDYMNIQMREDYIPVAAFRSVHEEMHPFVMEGTNLLNMMIQRGKEAYFVAHVLPFVPEYTRLGYTEEQLKWCNDNEALVYNFFIQADLLYSTDWQKIIRYIKEGPTSVGLNGSPGNIGTWMGYKIVNAYAQAHPKMTLPELMNEEIKEQAFLQSSGYKPQK